VGVLNDEEAEAEVDELLKEFLRRNDGDPKPCGSQERKKLVAFAKRDGREKFRSAARAWLSNQPWTVGTKFPFGTLISNYAMYAMKPVHDSSQQKTTEEDVKRTYEIAAEAHAEQWGLNKAIQIDPEPGPEGFL
jgi:hypothetical protein